jgi:hypothetical protein
MSAKQAWRLGAWASLTMSTAAVSMGACSSNTTPRTTTSTSSSTTTTTSTTSSSTSTSSGDGSASTGGLCGLPASAPANSTLYTGGIPNPNCPTSIAYAGNYWFSYFDSATALSMDGTDDAAAFGFIHTGDMNGCDGPSDCAFHAVGNNIPGYGAGVGFTLNNNAAIGDAGGFTGFQVWLKGTTTGTRGQGYSPSDNTVHVKFVTTLADGGDPRVGDNFGAYCATTGDGATDQWVLCKLRFDGLTRDGFRSVEAGAPDPATDMFDFTNLAKIQFEFSAYTPQADSGAIQQVSFDVWIDDASFY